jgi:methyl-accepting chemotaxis protein
MLKNLSLKTQLGVGFATVVALFLATLVLVAQLVARLEHGVRGFSEKELPQVLAVERMNLSRSEVQQFLTDVSTTHDPAAYAEAEDALKS